MSKKNKDGAMVKEKTMAGQKVMTKQEVIGKLAAMCARAEHCGQDMRKRMERWGIESEVQQEMTDYLVSEGYIDEGRYARYFINDKVRFNKWGRRKVEQALRMKGIAQEVYAPLLDEVERETYEEVLMPLLRSKARTVKYKSDYERRMKLIRYAMQRGFSYDEAEHCLAQM